LHQHLCVVGESVLVTSHCHR